MAYVFAACVLIVTAGVLWFHIVRPILEDYGVIRVESEPESVNRSGWLLSTDRDADHQTGQTDGADRPQTPDVSALLRLIDQVGVDRTRVAWIELMVYKGYSVGEIRSLLKGDNGIIGTEVEQARQRLGIDVPDRQLRVRDASGERVIPMR